MSNVEKLVERFITDLRQTLVAEVLAAANRGAGRRVQPVSGGRRTAGQLQEAREALLAAVRKWPSQRIEQLAEKLGCDAISLNRPMQQLRTEGRVRIISGVARGARYVAVRA